ncbi:peptidoglycan/LPS O-acetylase OafA/YrhL [Novosphingobium sp. PhB165]|uniref:acyltransferase family protein n=1 Tax=Novosphingobium sp. PhB165 TaxID=2485105 RepID=UPI0010441112|nr:acyltransferase [Novosphingobium sp. PhB165]TCM20579.1 peptidoglycan/LPS O-acetylase OafA/YrhL [Novosphingobium sp. PhB165]
MKHLNVVQGARALAAVFVVISHGAAWAVGFGSLGFPLSDFELLGSMGVLMFFTISGFIMVHVARDGFGETGAPGNFLRRRIARVVPLYWLMTLVAAAIVVKDARPLDMGYFVQTLLFIPHAAAGRLMLPVLGVGWTLNYEMFFYVLFTAALFMRRGLAILCMALAVLLAIGQMLHPVWDHRDARSVLEFWTAPLLLPFLLGIGIAVVRRGAPWLRVHRPLLLMLCGVAIIVAMQQLLIAPGSELVWKRVGLPVDAAIIAAFAILAPSTIPVPAWLVLTGDASFSLYLVHPLLFGVASRLGGRALGLESPPLAIVFYVTLSIAAGMALYFMVERPLTRRCARVLASWGPKPQAIPLPG